jgi:hypothetical protein
MKSFLLSLFYVSVLFAGEATPPDFYETNVTLSDLERMKQSLKSGETHWQNEKGFVVRCGGKTCSVSCDPQPPEDAPQGELIKDNKWCGIQLKAIQIDEFLGLIQKAGTQSEAQSDPLKMATCNSDGCILRHQK